MAATTLEIVAAYCCTALAGTLGAVLSAYVRRGGHWLTYYIAGMLSIATWAWLAKRSTLPLMLTSTIWDIVYSITFTGSMYFIDIEPISRAQLFGVVLVSIGLLLIGK